MTCPRQDGELIVKTIPQPGDMLLEYRTCPTCHGTWLRAFDANFLKNNDIETTIDTFKGTSLQGGNSIPKNLICPNCGFKLTRTTGANIPDNVLAFRCPNGHGYYFPAGELSKFKVAQEAKIQYHKTWNIPLSSVAATLLTGLVGIILSAGLVLGVIGGQQEQNITSQAQEIISFKEAYVSKTNNSVTFVVGTTAETTLTIHINQTNYAAPLQTVDQKSHVLRVMEIGSGSYSYYFTFKAGGKSLRSETYTFLMP